MKRILILFALAFMVNMASMAQISKSYMQMEIYAPSNAGPLTAAPDRVGMWVEWSEDGNKLTMLDGTIWKYIKSDAKGNRYYTFVKSTMPIMPGTIYHEAVLIPDATKLQVFYSFGLMGMYVKMRATYGYIGEGKQPALDYINGKFDE